MDGSGRLTALAGRQGGEPGGVGRAFVTREDRIDWLEEMALPALVMTGCEDKAALCWRVT